LLRNLPPPERSTCFAQAGSGATQKEEAGPMKNAGRPGPHPRFPNFKT